MNLQELEVNRAGALALWLPRPLSVAFLAVWVDWLNLPVWGQIRRRSLSFYADKIGAGLGNRIRLARMRSLRKVRRREIQRLTEKWETDPNYHEYRLLGEWVCRKVYRELPRTGKRWYY